jgi:hypothetical protein
MARHLSDAAINVSGVPPSLRKYTIPRISIRKYLVIGIILIITIVSIRSYRVLAYSHRYCGSENVPEDYRSGVWKVPMKVVSSTNMFQE